MPSVSVENYLKAIYHLGGHSAAVKTKDIAVSLEVSLPSVSSMIQSLSNDELVDHQRYRGATLTERGRIAALKVIRKHRLVEMFLVETLDYGWDEVHAEAEQLEHAVSDDLAERISKFLGNPEFDPHGDPIPSADGTVRRRDAQPLCDASAGENLRIVRVLDQQPDVLRHLTRLGLTPQACVEVVEVLEFDGQMTLVLGESQVQVSEKLASRLLVESL